jgi:N-methylhydantoinase B
LRPITFEIVRGALRGTLSEMDALIERTAMSPFIREKKDFYAALFDPRHAAPPRTHVRGLRGPH